MEPNLDTVKTRLKELFSTQLIGTLGTVGLDGGSYGSLVGFAVTEDLKTLLFATPRQSRKADNLQRNPKVSIVVDNRSNQASDFQEAFGVTIVGVAHEVPSDKRAAWEEVFLQKHPVLHDFLRDPGCAFIAVRIENVYFVRRFQTVTEWHPGS